MKISKRLPLLGFSLASFVVATFSTSTVYAAKTSDPVIIEWKEDFNYQAQKQDFDADTANAAFLTELSLKLYNEGLFKLTAPKGQRSTGDYAISHVDAAYSSSDFRTAVFVRLWVSPNRSNAKGKILKNEDGFLFHSKTKSGVPYAMFMRVPSEEQALRIVNDVTVVASHIPTQSQRKFFSQISFLSEAHAAEGDCVPGSSPVLNQSLFQKGLSAAEGVIQNPYVQGSYGCVLGAVQGAWDSTGGLVVGAYNAATDVVFHPVKTAKSFWHGVNNTWDTVVAFYNDFDREANKVYRGFASLDPKTKGRIACEVASSIGTGVLMSLFTFGAEAAAVAKAIAQALAKIEKLPEYAKVLTPLKVSDGVARGTASAETVGSSTDVALHSKSAVSAGVKQEKAASSFGAASKKSPDSSAQSSNAQAASTSAAGDNKIQAVTVKNDKGEDVLQVQLRDRTYHFETVEKGGETKIKVTDVRTGKTTTLAAEAKDGTVSLDPKKLSEAALSLDPTLNLQAGKAYHIHANQDSKIQTLTYLGKEREGNRFVLRFKDAKGSEVKLSDDVVHDVAPLMPDKTVSKYFNRAFMQYPMTASLIGRLMFRPMTTLAKSGSLEAVGAPWVSKSLAETIVKNVSQFDSSVEKFGFTLPDKTRLVIKDKPILPDVTGPAYINGPVVNIFDPSTKSTIAMNPIFWSKRTLTEPSVSFHERMHSILFRTYSSDAFVNRSKTVQEALADFSAAHINESPVIGPKAMMGQDIRNIETRRAANSKSSVDSLLAVKGGIHAHDDSMLFSNVLWRVRESVGKDRMSSLLKPVVDDLNKNFDSYQAMTNGVQTVDRRQGTIDHFVYFLASLKKTGSRMGAAREIDATVAQAADELKISQQQINDVANKLSLSDKSYVYENKSRVGQGILLSAIGANGLALDGYFLYQIIPDSLIPGASEPNKASK